MEAEILDGLTNVTVTYHVTQNDALAGVNPISDPTNFGNTVQTEQIIYIRVVDNITGCPSTAPIEIHTNLLLSEPDFSNYEQCDIDNDGTEAFDLLTLTSRILSDIPDVTITFYETEGDRANNLNAIDTSMAYFPISTPHVLYLTLVSPTCTEVEEIVLDLNPIIEFPNLTQQTVCDQDQDGIVNINLSQYDELLYQGQTGFVVTYFETLQDAEDSNNQLPTIYQNSQNPFTVFARITSVITSCTDISSFEILVNPAPETTNANPIIICDDDQDGFFIINLENTISEIVESTTDRSITFFVSTTDADNNTNPINNPDNYNAETETVIARVENTLTGCYSLENILITVNTLPVFPVISDFNFCEDNTDNVGEFLLSSKDIEILNGQSGKEVLYFLTENDANTNNNPIDKNSDFENTINPQVIYTRVQNITDASCYGVDSFVLNVGTNPLFNEPTNIFMCDDALNDMFVTINLNEKTSQITSEIDDNLVVTYYASLEDFQSGSNPILGGMFTNTSNPQEVYVEISNGTICTSTSSFTINVIPVPTVTEIPTLEDCDVDYDGSIMWDLTEIEINILNVRQGNIIVSYFTSQEDADNDINFISNPDTFINTVNPQTVFVKVTDTDFNCPLVLPITLNVITPPTFNDFGSITICDNDNNSYDLSQVSTILGDVSIATEISYYSNEQDAIDEINTLANNYTYQTNSDIIYARIENIASNCFYVYPFMIFVNDRPIANTPNNLEGCDDDLDGQLVFNLEDQTNSILGTQDDTFLEVTYHNSKMRLWQILMQFKVLITVLMVKP